MGVDSFPWNQLHDSKGFIFNYLLGAGSLACAWLVYGVLLSHHVDPRNRNWSSALVTGTVTHCVIPLSSQPGLQFSQLKHSEVLEAGVRMNQLGLLAKTAKSKTLVTFKSRGAFGIVLTLSPRVWDEITMVRAKSGCLRTDWVIYTFMKQLQWGSFTRLLHACPFVHPFTRNKCAS